MYINEITNYTRTKQSFHEGVRAIHPLQKKIMVTDHLWFDKLIAAFTQLNTVHYGSI